MSLRSLGLNSAMSRLFSFSKPAPAIKSMQTILDFKNNPQHSLENIMTRCDKEIGGYSSVNFSYNNQMRCAHFHGYLNLDLPKDNPEITRSGYAMFRTKDQKESWLSGNSYWDWSPYHALVLRVNGDKRKYLVNIQANTPLVTDLFQHRLFLNTPGQWETVVIPLNDFVMTNWGVIQDGCEINKLEVKTIGVGLLDKQYGPFDLNIDWIKVMTDEELVNYSRSSEAAKQRIDNNQQDIKELNSSALHSSKFEDPKGTVF